MAPTEGFGPVHLLQQEFFNFTHKESCIFATHTADDLTSGYTYSNTNGTITKDANGAVTIDGGTLILDMRILIKNQTASAQNGVYIVTTVGTGSAALVLTRTNDFNSPTEITKGVYVAISSGTNNANTAHVMSTNATTTVIGTTQLTFTNVSTVDIAGQTEMTGDVADTDELLVSDAGTVKRADFSVVRDAVFNDVSSDATVAAGGALTIAADAVTYAKMQNLATGNRVLGSSSSGLIGEVQIATNMIATSAVDLTSKVTGVLPLANGGTGNGTGTAAKATTVNVASEAGANTCFPLFVTGATGDRAVKSNANLQFDSNIGSGAVSFKIAGGTSLLSCAGDITAFVSDKRLKTDIEIISNPLDKISKITGFTYGWDKEVCDKIKLDTDDKRHIGVYAQDIQAVIPEAVKPAPFDTDSKGNSISGDNYLTVQYEKIVPLLIESIKEQQTQINLLREEINLLKK